MGNTSDSLKAQRQDDVVLFLATSTSDDSSVPPFVAGDFAVPFCHKKRICCLKYDPARNLLWSGGMDKIVCAWNPRNGKCVHFLKGHTAVVTCIDIDVEDEAGIVYTGSFDRSIFGWNPRTGRIVQKFPKAKNWISCVVVSNGLVFSAGYDCTITVFRASTAQRLAELVGHTMRIEDLRVNSAEGVLYSSSLDGTVREWDMDSGECLRSFSSRRSGLVNLFHVRRRKCMKLALDPMRSHLFCMSGEEELTCWGVTKDQEPSEGQVRLISPTSEEQEEEGEGEVVVVPPVAVVPVVPTSSRRGGRKPKKMRKKKKKQRGRKRRRDDVHQQPVLTMRLSAFDVYGNFLVGWNTSRSALEIWDLRGHTLVASLDQPIIKTGNVCLSHDFTYAFLTTGSKIVRVDVSKAIKKRKRRMKKKIGDAEVIPSVHVRYARLLYYFASVVGVQFAEVEKAVVALDDDGTLEKCRSYDDRVAAVDAKLGAFKTKGGSATIAPPEPKSTPVSAQAPPAAAVAAEESVGEVAAAPTTATNDADWKALVDFELLLGGPVPESPYVADELTWSLEKKTERFLQEIVGESRDLQPTVLVVRREQLVSDACKHFALLGNDDFRKPMYVFFANEAGLDTGGVTREFYHLLSEQILDPGHALFSRTSSNSYHPNPSSAVNQAHLQYFEFIGKLIGKAFYDMQMLDLHFSPVIFKLICGRSIVFQDLRNVDPVLYESLRQLLTMKDVQSLDLRFCVDVNDFGLNNTTPLIDDGANVVVTDDNKHEFVRRYCQWALIDSIRPQLENLLQGLYDVIPRGNFLVFDPTELELCLCGSQDVVLEDWVAFTAYEGLSEESPSVKVFWETLESKMDEVERSRLLQFVTGSTCVPVEGFRGLSPPFTLCRLHGSTNQHLPVAHTCLNRLEIPLYVSADQCCLKIKQALVLGKKFEFV